MSGGLLYKVQRAVAEVRAKGGSGRFVVFREAGKNWRTEGHVLEMEGGPVTVLIDPDCPPRKFYVFNHDPRLDD